MSRLRRSMVAFLAVLLLAGLVRAMPAGAEQAREGGASRVTGGSRAAPASMWQGWQSFDVPVDPFLRDVVADYAELDEDPEVRKAAQAALDAFTTAALEAFMATGIDEAKTRAKDRKAGVARQHRKQIEAMAGTGGAIFNAEVVRVLAGTDGDRADFLAYGAQIARQRDEQAQLNAEARLKQLRDRVRLLVATGGLELRKAAQAALDAGDAAIADFFAKGGYEAAVNRDVQAR
ncbi:ALF repeat-containing protein [Amycolatopsis sp. VS8301801F10]|uniref:ALF repeat-containing protein n=1 Tax=Amycolatopsis sp. VS8301801F10 TaxID=2652442 RepID=UPI0038FCD6D3